jgi:hypothetical protein
VRREMNIRDFRGNYEVGNTTELEAVLSRRYLNGENWFLLCVGNENEPCMTLAVRGDVATLHYMRNSEDTGFRSIGGIMDYDQDVTFRMTENSDFPVCGDAVLPFSVALSAAKEFFGSPELPKSIEWLEI